VILMSATIDAERFCQYFGTCPLLIIPGMMFPVEEFYLEDVLEATSFTEFPFTNQGTPFSRHSRSNDVRRFEEDQKRHEYSAMIRPYINSLKETGKYSNRVFDLLSDYRCEELCLELVAALIHTLARGPEGGILVFLPGFADISTVCKLLQNSVLPPHVLLPLHSKLNSTEQHAVFRRPPAGVRKIVVATNIAETSITIDDIVYVVDAGKIKMTDYVVNRDMTTLKGEWVSEANAHQRLER
jgi:ATP-dependent RNA helicase DHX36